MNPQLHQLANIAREHADSARALAHLCLEVTDLLETITDTILREPVSVPIDNGIPPWLSREATHTPQPCHPHPPRGPHDKKTRPTRTRA